MEESMDKKVEKLIEEKTNNILEKYKFNTFDYLFDEKINYFKKIKNILIETLITPQRKKNLCKKYDLPFNAIFTSNSNIYFSPNFEEALKYIPPYLALLSFEDVFLPNLKDEICYNENIIKLITKGVSLYYTKEELPNIFKEFYTFIENNERSIIDSGWPKYKFSKSLWLFYTLSPTYPIKMLKIIKRSNCIESIESNFKQTSFIGNFSFKEIGFIEEIRPKIFNLKKIIIKNIYEKLISGITREDFWIKDCFEMLLSNISEDEYNKLAKIEEKYSKYKIYNYKLHGGLSNLITIIYQIFVESKLGGVDLLKNTLQSLIKDSIFSDQKDFKSLYQFYQFIQDDEDNEFHKKRLNKYIEESSENDKKSYEILQFASDILKVYKSQYLKKSLLIKPKYYSFIENLLKNFEQGEKFNLNLNLSSKLATSSQKGMTPLNLPPNTEWGQIILKFIDKESIEITGPKDYREIATFREMGFENRKKSGRPPNKLWIFLQALASVKGTFSWDLLKERTRNPNIKDAMDNARKRKQLVNQKLKAFFNLKEDPITYDRKNKIYETAFTITSEIEFY